VPEFTEELVDLIAGQSDAQSGAYTIRELERIRDGNLVGFLRSLKDRNWGAGKVLREHDERRRVAYTDGTRDVAAEPMTLAHLQVLPSWIDYNGHMTESRYLFASSEVSDAFLRFIGADMDYVASGFSYYTAESHIMHKGEAKLGDRLTGSVQVLAADEKRLHIFVRIQKDGEDVATIEQMLLHVDMKAGRAVAAPVAILDRLMPVAKAHAGLPRDASVGRFTGQRK
jgi:carnitine 3-dehydrogenase